MVLKWMTKSKRCEWDTRTYVRHRPKGMKEFEIYTNINNLKVSLIMATWTSP